MAQARQLKYGVANCHEAVIEYAKWLNNAPLTYSCTGDMPRRTAIGFDYLVSTLNRNPEGERASIHAEHEKKMLERMNKLG